MNLEPSSVETAHGKQKLFVDRLSKSYGSVQALKATTLSVKEGEFLTLLGPSGSGKTTLLMMIAGLVAPSEGAIWIDGTDATRIPPNRRDIGMVFQNYALFPHLTVFENIAFPLRMRMMKDVDIKRKVQKILEVVALPHVANRLPRELSGGQQQRIALARSAVYEPSVILMDEPLGALDKKLRDNMQAEIRRLHREIGATVVYVTHDQGEAMSMSDRVCLMQGGGIEQIGSPEDLYFFPKTRFTGDFLGGTNFLPGTVVGHEETLWIVRMQWGDTIKAARLHSGNGRAQVGDRCEVMVRPQHLTMSGAAQGYDNCVDGRILGLTMAGLVTEYDVELPMGAKIVVGGLTTEPDTGLSRGDEVRLYWSSRHTIIFPTSGSTL